MECKYFNGGSCTLGLNTAKCGRCKYRQVDNSSVGVSGVSTNPLSTNTMISGGVYKLEESANIGKLSAVGGCGCQKH